MGFILIDIAMIIVAILIVAFCYFLLLNAVRIENYNHSFDNQLFSLLKRFLNYFPGKKFKSAIDINTLVNNYIVEQRNNPFFQAIKSVYILKNNYVCIKYDTALNNITCQDNNEKYKIFTINWEDYKYNNSQDYSYNEQKRTIFGAFLTISQIFSKDTRYENVNSILASNFFIKYMADLENSNPPKVYYDDDLIDINTATLEEIKKLPGINIALAKRIIKYREEHNGFKSLDEFYDKFDIKEHFRKQMNYRIVLIIKDENKINNNYGERIIDI